MKMNRWLAASAAATLSGGLLIAASPANAAAPPPPPTCSATEQADGDVTVNWTHPTGADPAINWYTIREKGYTSPSPNVDPDVNTYEWTDTQRTSPQIMMVRSHNPHGVSDWCEATVGNAPPAENLPPVVSAGPDLSGPVSTVFQLDGSTSDPEGTNVTESWTKVSGPGTVTWTCRQCQDATAKFSAAGTYVVRLTGTDATGKTASDEATVTVGSTPDPDPVNVPPGVDAGADQTVTLPASANLDGTITKEDSETVTQVWTKAQGPGTVSFGTPNNVDTTASFSVDGVYTLRLTATDNGGATASDTVQVTVKPEVVDPGPDPNGVNPLVAVRVFPHYTGTLYADHERVLDKLGALGVDRISARIIPGLQPDEIAFYQNAYNRHGIKIWFAVGVPGNAYSDAEWGKIEDLLNGPLKGMVEVASGWNEPNHRVANFVQPTAAHQAKLWTAINNVNNATNQNIKVGTPPLWSGNIDEQFTAMRQLAPAIKGKYNLINWHMYPHGQTGASLDAMVQRQVTEYRDAYGNFPMMNSEGGYSTSVNSSQGNPVTEAQQAAQVGPFIDMHTSRGIQFSYFEAADDVDPGFTNREAHFGLWRVDWSNKPAFNEVMERTD